MFNDENENVNNINQPNGTIVTDNRGPQLRTIENELYKKLKEDFSWTKISLKLLTIT